MQMHPDQQKTNSLLPKPAGSRRTSNGCVQCKTRKVKCDEARPKCFKCIKHKVDCSFDTKSSSPAPQQPDPITKLQEFELLHHFSTRACFTLSNRQEVQLLMRDCLVKTFFPSREFLLYSVFAISALHLAHTRPTQQAYYTSLAVTCQNIALNRYQTAASNIDPRNGEAFFAFATMVTVYSLAISALHGQDSVHEPPEDVIDSAISWMNLTRGVGTVLVSYMHHISTGDFGILLRGIPLETEHELYQNTYSKELNSLPMMWNRPEIPTDEQEVYSQTLHQLRIVISWSEVKSDGKCDLGSATGWLGRSGHEFTILLARRKPIALVILAWFCVVLNGGKEFWCIGNLPKRLLAAIQAIMEEPYREWIKVPLEALDVLPQERE